MEKKSGKIVDEILKELRTDNVPLPENFGNELFLKMKNRRKSVDYFSIFKLVASFSLLVAVFLAGFYTSEIKKTEKNVTENMVDSKNEKKDIGNITKTSVSVSTGEQLTVKLVYEATEDIDDVLFTIILPEGLSFHTEDELLASEKIVTWQGSLKKGKNIIPFVVDAETAGKWIIKANAGYGETIHRHQIDVNINSEGEVENV